MMFNLRDWSGIFLADFEYFSFRGEERRLHTCEGSAPRNWACDQAVLQQRAGAEIGDAVVSKQAFDCARVIGRAV